MAGINSLGGTYVPQITPDEPEVTLHFTQLQPPRDVQAVAQQNVQNSAMAEALESMSLVMGGRLRNHERKSDGRDRLTDLRDKLMAWVPKVSGIALAELLSQFSELGSGPHDPLQAMEQAGVDPGAMALILASLLNDGRLSPQRRRKLEHSLEALLADENIPVDIFTWLEIGGLDKQNLAPVRMLYERSRKQDDSPESLLAWYQEVCDWPDREKKLRVLIQALGSELGAEGDHQQINRITHAIGELKRLLIFFNLSDHSYWVAHASGMTQEAVLRDVLTILSQLWMYADWLADRVNTYRLTLTQQIAWVRVMREFIHTLPALCFRDDEHQGQVIEALEQLQDKLADNE